MSELVKVENKRLLAAFKEMPCVNLEFRTRLDMDAWTDWRNKYFTASGRYRKKALTGETE